MFAEHITGDLAGFLFGNGEKKGSGEVRRDGGSGEVRRDGAKGSCGEERWREGLCQEERWREGLCQEERWGVKWGGENK